MHDTSAFTVQETHGRVLRPGNRVLMDSEHAGWRSLHAATFEEAPFHATERPAGHPSFIYHLTRPTEVTRRIDGEKRERALIGPRQICITPGTSTTQWEHSGRPEILQVYLRRSLYERTVEELYGRRAGQAELAPRFAIRDPFLEQMALAVLGALRDGSTSEGLYIDTIAQMIALHLARTCAGVARDERLRFGGTLPERRIRQLTDYIEDHLAGDVSLDRLATEVNVSPVYLARVFKTALGQAPHQYVVSRRIERAKALLREGDDPIVDVALRSGFSSQSHLSSWFLRLVGVSPAAYRRQK